MKPRLLVPMLIVALICAGTKTEAAPLGSAAQGHLDAALKHYAQRRYEAAITEFRAAYEKEPRREILFAWAQAERLSGDCPSAMALYQKFLGSDPTSAEESAARLNLKRCEEALGQPAAPPPAPTPPPPAVVPPPTVTPPPPSTPPPTRTSWRQDRLGIGLTAAGGLTLAVGAVLAGVSATNAPQGALTYQAYTDRLGSAEGLRAGGLVLVGVGAGILVTGIVRLILVARRDKGHVARLTPIAVTF